MAKISEQFGAAFLKAEDFDKAGKVLTIDRVEDEVDVGDEKRIVVYFDGESRGLPLNKTNAITLAEMYGDDTDDWAGKSCRVYRDTTMFQGKRTPCMRIGGGSRS